MTLVDSNVLIDILFEDPVWFDWSIGTLSRMSRAGPIAIVDVVYSEISIGFDDRAELDTAISLLGLVSLPMSRQALLVAGKTFRDYRRNGGQKLNVLPDFLIGAQAMASGVPLMTRDRRRYASRFPGIDLITP